MQLPAGARDRLHTGGDSASGSPQEKQTLPNAGTGFCMAAQKQPRGLGASQRPHRARWEPPTAAINGRPLSAATAPPARLHPLPRGHALSRLRPSCAAAPREATPPSAGVRAPEVTNRKRKWLRAWSEDGECGLAVSRRFAAAAAAVLFVKAAGGGRSACCPSRRLCPLAEWWALGGRRGRAESRESGAAQFRAPLCGQRRR